MKCSPAVPGRRHRRWSLNGFSHPLTKLTLLTKGSQKGFCQYCQYCQGVRKPEKRAMSPHQSGEVVAANQMPGAFGSSNSRDTLGLTS